MTLRLYRKRYGDQHNAMPSPYRTRLYLSYDAVTQQITIITTGLDQFYLCMVKELFKASSRPEEIVPRLLLLWFAMAEECFAEIAEVWDVNTDGIVCSGKPLSSLAPHLADPLFSIGDGITSGGKLLDVIVPLIMSPACVKQNSMTLLLYGQRSHRWSSVKVCGIH